MGGNLTQEENGNSTEPILREILFLFILKLWHSIVIEKQFQTLCHLVASWDTIYNYDKNNDDILLCANEHSVLIIELEI